MELNRTLNFIMFYHSVISDWNHGNAHFLRGIAQELINLGHSVAIYEPANGWSLANLLQNEGPSCIQAYNRAFPKLESHFYDLPSLNLSEVLDKADVVLVHEWNDPELISSIGKYKLTSGRFLLFFHDTHHRSVSATAEISEYNLEHYDGVLAFGEVIRDLYIENGWNGRAWTWHEAADTSIFKPLNSKAKIGDVVWVGNWGDNERTEEIKDFFILPISELKLKASVYGVRYPHTALELLRNGHIRYCGWTPNFKVPEIFSEFNLTLHIPRRPYVESLPGIPTIRVFEALACGIPLICAQWEDSEGLFRPGVDFLMARSGSEMKERIRDILNDKLLASQLAANGLETITSRHTCKHRAFELLDICNSLTAQKK